MTNNREPERWMRDARDGQRNLVFPDTANNEARFWRNVINGQRCLTLLQVSGLFVFGLWVAVLAFAITFEKGFSWDSVLAGSLRWLIGFGVIAAFLLAFSIVQLWTRLRRSRRPRR